ncbi:MAG: VanW family protein [Chloroflexota bacterium]
MVGGTASLVLVGAVILLTGFVLLNVFAFQAYFEDRMYPGVRALGVPVGRLSRAEAASALRDRAHALATRPIDLQHQELHWTVVTAHLGVSPDVDRVLERAYAVGREGGMLGRFFTQFGVLVLPAAYEVTMPDYDAATMAAFMQLLSAAVDRPVVDASLSFAEDGRVVAVASQSGRKLDVEATRRGLEEAIAREEARAVELTVVETSPRVASSDIQATRIQLERLMSGPLVFQFGNDKWELSTRQLATMVDVDPARGATMRQALVKAFSEKLSRDVSQTPRSARFSWTNGELQLIRESRDGRELDVDETVRLISARAFDEQRTITLPISVAKPDVTEADAEKLNIQGVIEAGRTAFVGASPPKQANIALATQRLNGVVVPPGKVFSFNREVGPTSIDAGFKVGWGIANGGQNVKTVPSVAGGICQVATTLFHAVFWSGYQIEERHSHLYWIPSYGTRGTEGLDATVDEESDLDFRFMNNSDSYLLIQSWTEGPRVVFALYGTKPDWSVKVIPGERKDVITASKDQIIEQEPTLPAGQRLAVEGAMDGFKITNTRQVKLGSELRTLHINSNYRPSRNVTLEGTGGKPPGPPQVISRGGTDTRTSAPAATAVTARPTATPQPSAPRPVVQPTNPLARPAAPPAGR